MSYNKRMVGHGSDIWHEPEGYRDVVTEIGCGLAGLKPKEVAPLFKDAVNVFNIHLPSRFWHKCSNGA